MRNYFIIFFLVTLSFVSCERSEINEMQVSTDTTLLNGSWRVEQFIEGSIDETRSFTSVRFRFEANGVFNVLLNNTLIATGSWAFKHNGSHIYIDVPAFANEQRAIQQFGEDVYEIHDDWKVISFTTNRLHIKSDEESFMLMKE
ncbi:MAG: hypothetical protein ACO3BD_07500 [Chitinophagaceae bacterium]